MDIHYRIVIAGLVGHGMEYRTNCWDVLENHKWVCYVISHWTAVPKECQQLFSTLLMISDNDGRERGHAPVWLYYEGVSSSTAFLQEGTLEAD